MGWDALGLEEAIAQADGRRVALKVGAAWCSMCDELDRAVLDTPAGAALFDGAVTVAADADSADGEALVERFAILELPTVVVLEGGEETGRVVGFEDATDWIERAREALSATDPIGPLRARHEADPEDDEAALALGEALLSRAPDEGLTLLERVSLGDGARAARALWTIGRYQHRVRRDPEGARFVWQQLGARFADRPVAMEAWWWYAKAQAARGRPELGSAAYEALARRHPGDPAILLEWARSASRLGHEPARPAIRDAAMRALRSARGADRDELEALVMNLSAPFDAPHPPERGRG